MQSNIHQYYPSFYTFIKAIFPGQAPVPPRSGTWILDLSHHPIWAIWLAEVSRFHRHHDGMQSNTLFDQQWWQMSWGVLWISWFPFVCVHVCRKLFWKKNISIVCLACAQKRFKGSFNVIFDSNYPIYIIISSQLAPNDDLMDNMLEWVHAMVWQLK